MKKISLLLTLTLLFTSFILYGCSNVKPNEITNQLNTITSQHTAGSDDWLAVCYYVSDTTAKNHFGEDIKYNTNGERVSIQLTYDCYGQVNGVIREYASSENYGGYIVVMNIGEKYFVEDYSSDMIPSGQITKQEFYKNFSIHLYYFGDQKYYLLNDDGTYRSLTDDSVLTQQQAEKLYDKFVLKNY